MRKFTSPVVAAALLAFVAMPWTGGGTDAVTSRTSEGVGAIASPAPQASAGPATATAPLPVAGPAAPGSELTVFILAVVAAAGFGRGTWLLRGRGPVGRVP